MFPLNLSTSGGAGVATLSPDYRPIATVLRHPKEKSSVQNKLQELQIQGCRTDFSVLVENQVVL